MPSSKLSKISFHNYHHHHCHQQHHQNHIWVSLFEKWNLKKLGYIILTTFILTSLEKVCLKCDCKTDLPIEEVLRELNLWGDMQCIEGILAQFYPGRSCSHNFCNTKICHYMRFSHMVLLTPKNLNLARQC